MKIKFVCLNLWRGGLLFDKIIPFLEKEQPDILAVQEVLHSDDPELPDRYHSLDTIQAHLHFPAVDFAPAFIDNDDSHRVPSGNAVLSRFPITGRIVTAYDQPFGERTAHNLDTFAVTPRNLQHITIQAGSVELNVFNTQGVWDLEGEKATKRRWAMCRTIAQQTAGKQHVILAGDFNLKPVNETLAPIDAQLQSVFGHELITTFNIRHKNLAKFPGYATAVVDLLYVSHDMRVLDHDCPNVDVSDHLPLTATLETL